MGVRTRKGPETRGGTWATEPLGIAMPNTAGQQIGARTPVGKSSKVPFGSLDARYAPTPEHFRKNDKRYSRRYMYGPKIVKLATLGLVPAARQADTARTKALRAIYVTELLPERVVDTKRVYSYGEQPIGYTGRQLRYERLRKDCPKVVGTILAVGALGFVTVALAGNHNAAPSNTAPLNTPYAASGSPSPAQHPAAAAFRSGAIVCNGPTRVVTMSKADHNNPWLAMEHQVPDPKFNYAGLPHAESLQFWHDVAITLNHEPSAPSSLPTDLQFKVPTGCTG